jgi:hypothetical protein
MISQHLYGEVCSDVEPLGRLRLELLPCDRRTSIREYSRYITLLNGENMLGLLSLLVEELEDTYTRGSVKNFSSILTNIADAKKKDNLTNFSENDAARLLKALQNAIDGLVPYASYADIDVKLAEISALDKTAYTEESWAALDAAVKAVAELKQNRNASKPQSDSALTALNTALEGLVKVVVEEAPVVEEESGCKSAIGATIVVMTATLALGATAVLRKKED